MHDLSSPAAGITNAVFEILRNANSLIPEVEPNLVVCWGGHSITAARIRIHQGLRLSSWGCAP